MSQYRNLASYWSALFPVSPAHQRFLEPFVNHCAGASAETDPTGTKKGVWADVGCGAGNLLLWLTGRGVTAWGLEPDEDFIAEARRRLAGTNQRVLRGGMLDIERMASLAENACKSECRNTAAGQEIPPPSHWSMITCLGNVLAHAADSSEAREFFRMAAASLDAKGALLLQVVNYDKVFATETWSFPVLRRTAEDGTELTFERRYRMDEYREGERLIFETILRTGEEVIENSAALLPLRKTDLESMALECFADVTVHGDFEGTPWTAQSPATVLICRKEKL